MPQRLLFFEIGDLAERLRRVASDEVELVVLLQPRRRRRSRRWSTRGSLALFCTPAINLFHKRLDRIQLGTGLWEYHVVPDRTRPMDYEVHSIASVTGFGTGRGRAAGVPAAVRDLSRRTPPAEARRTATTRCGASRACCRRGRSSTARARRTSARRCSCRWSIRATRRTATTCASSRSRPGSTNRDLPTLLPAAAANDGAPRGGSIARARWRASTCCAARRGRSPAGRSGELGWSLVNHLTLNHLALVGETPQQAAAALRTMLGLYAPPEDSGWARQVEGVHGARGAQPSCGACRSRGRSTFGTGVEIVLELDELAFQGTQRLPASPACSSASSRATRRSTASPSSTLQDAAARRGDALAAAHRHAGDAVSALELAAAPTLGRRAARRPRRGAGRAVRALARRRARTTSSPCCATSRRCGRSCRASAARCGRRRSRCASARSRSSTSRRRRWRASTPARGRAPRLGVRFFGLLGPQGPMPLHFTEYVRERAAHPRRPDAGALPRHLPPPAARAVLPRLGAGAADGAPRPAGRRSLRAPGSAPASARRRRPRRRARCPTTAQAASRPGCWAARSRHAEGLAKLLRQYFGVPVRIEQHVGALAARSTPTTAAASASRAAGPSARDAARRSSACRRRAAASVRDRQYKFRVALGPLTLAPLPRLPARRAGLARLREWVQQLRRARPALGRRADARAPTEVPEPRLGRARAARRHAPGSAPRRRSAAATANDLRLRPDTSFLLRRHLGVHHA